MFSSRRYKVVFLAAPMPHSNLNFHTFVASVLFHHLFQPSSKTRNISATNYQPDLKIKQRIIGDFKYYFWQHFPLNLFSKVLKSASSPYSLIGNYTIWVCCASSQITAVYCSGIFFQNI